MMKLDISKNTILLLSVASICGSVCCASYAATPNSAKASNFKYIEPTGSAGNGKCPSPYDPLTIVLNNNTEPAGFFNGNRNAIWVNIYYVGFDDRPYYGDYLGYNSAKNTQSFPLETNGVITPSMQVILDKNNTNDRSGPIIASTGAVLVEGTQGGSFPVRSWKYSPGGLPPKGFELIESGGVVTPGTRYGDLLESSQFGQYTKVFTIDNIPQNLQSQMDMNWGDYVTLPMRSFSRIRIEVRVGLDAKPADLSKHDYALSEVVARWEAHAVSNKNGYMLQVDRSWLKSGSSNVNVSGGSGFADGSMKSGSTINILPADAIVINMKGTWKYSKVTEAGQPDSEFFTGSKITLSPLMIRKPTEVDGRPMSSSSAQPLITCD